VTEVDSDLLMKEFQDLKSGLASLRSEVRGIRELLVGNGMPGLVREVRRNTEYRIGAETRGQLLRFAVGSGWLLSLASLVFLLLNGKLFG